MFGLPSSDVSLVTSIVLKLLLLLILIGVIFATSTGGMLVWVIAGFIVLAIVWMLGVRSIGVLGGR